MSKFTFALFTFLAGAVVQSHPFTCPFKLHPSCSPRCLRRRPRPRSNCHPTGPLCERTRSTANRDYVKRRPAK